MFVNRGGWAIIIALIVVFAYTAAPATAAPTPAPSATATPKAAPPIPKDFDPCGGPLELLNKIGSATPCVFVRGEAAITAQYGSVNIPVNSQINFDTPLGSRTLGLSSSAHAFGYPASLVYIGVLPRAEIIITPPSFVQVNGSSPVHTENNVLAAGASDMKFDYKQLVYVDHKKFTMFGVDFAYSPPTGSPSLSAAGPTYTINSIITQPLPHQFGVTLALPVNNFTIVNPPMCGMHPTGGTFCQPGGTQRGWSWTPLLVPFWESRGGTLLLVVIQHSFHPSVTPVTFSASQLIGRHFSVALAEGGFDYSGDSTGPLRGVVSASSTAYPNIFTVGVNYLFGRSDLPAHH